MEPAHCPEFPRCSHSRAEWHLGKRISTLAPGFPANRGTAPDRGRSVITPQLCMLSYHHRDNSQQSSTIDSLVHDRPFVIRDFAEKFTGPEPIRNATYSLPQGMLF
jgi:hypothetical protein